MALATLLLESSPLSISTIISFAFLAKVSGFPPVILVSNLEPSDKIQSEF